MVIMLISYGNNLYTSTMHMHTIRTYPYFGSRCPHFVNVYIKCVLYMCTNHNPIGYKLIIKPKSFVSINVCAYHLCLDIMLPPRQSLSLSFLVQSFLKWLLILAGHKSWIKFTLQWPFLHDFHVLRYIYLITILTLIYTTMSIY